MKIACLFVLWLLISPAAAAQQGLPPGWNDQMEQEYQRDQQQERLRAQNEALRAQREALEKEVLRLQQDRDSIYQHELDKYRWGDN